MPDGNTTIDILSEDYGADRVPDRERLADTADAAWDESKAQIEVDPDDDADGA